VINEGSGLYPALLLVVSVAFASVIEKSVWPCVTCKNSQFESVKT